MATVELTKDNFEQTVNENPMVIVGFLGAMVRSCRGFAPVYERRRRTHKGVRQGEYRRARELAGAFQIRSIPTLMVFRRSHPVPAGRRAPRKRSSR